MEAHKEDETLKATQAPAKEDAADAKANEAQEPQEDLTTAYQRLLAEKQEYYELALRKQAELDNFRKRTQREKEEFLQHANADLMRSLLPVLDGFDRALKHRDPAAPAQFYQGFDLIHRQLLDTLGRAGLTMVETKGETFNPNIHQAVETVESDRHRDHEIVEEMQHGYKLKQRLLRPAVVKVAVRSTNAAVPEETEEDD
ncbi:MAG: nucleotide exchange factor GrpE [Terriglobia bacterium]